MYLSTLLDLSCVQPLIYPMRLAPRNVGLSVLIVKINHMAQRNPKVAVFMLFVMRLKSQKLLQIFNRVCLDRPINRIIVYHEFRISSS